MLIGLHVRYCILLILNCLINKLALKLNLMKKKISPAILLILLTIAFVVVIAVSQTKQPPDPFINELSQTAISTEGVCPPFYLLTEDADTINPVKGLNSDKPYSAKQTCGKCHDYDKITEGYHFQQGKGEKLPEKTADRYQWASTPGNYGGNWCSPAPLYKYLSKKNNDGSRMMDMTSFDFVVSCGKCHPGGGSLEYDRDGFRYDKVMADITKGFVSGGNNNFDGDYFKARWLESGVIEADCFLCHMPEYDNNERIKHLDKFNFRWAATAGSGLAEVTGSVKDNIPVKVIYNKSLFSNDGKIEPHIVKEPRDKACLWCHAKPGWKKRGANFRTRTDVHLRAGLKCVDCHPAGTSSDNELIQGKEVHQFGKGDDPGGHVRDDLDNTGRSCLDCHETGYLGATVAKHKGLPPLHLERIACQTCHIPERTVKSAQFVASDVFNPGTKIPTKGKHLWTFYDPEMKYWNHYGDLEMMGYDDKPTDIFKPTLALYKGKIYPVNRVHTAWPAIKIEGQAGLMQPKMGDIYKMWTNHMADTSIYPELSKITDNNGDGVIEVNRPEEIDALIESITQMLEETKYPMEGKKVVWVINDRVFTSGTEYHQIEKESWEASPYGNIHTYNHDIYPAKAAIGSNGCSDCHSSNSSFFFSPVVQYPFDEKANPVYISQSEIMGYNGKPRIYESAAATTGSFFYWLTVIVMVFLIIHIVLDLISHRRKRKAETEISFEKGIQSKETYQRFDVHFLAQHLLLIISVFILVISSVFIFGARYPGAHWASVLTGSLGGIDFWRIIHRIGAILFIILCLYHLVYIVIHPEGRYNFKHLLPGWNDFQHLGQNLMWFFGLRNKPPHFGRFTY
ncbi:hypothetical protein ES705_10858 [subsurface metagenome]